MELISIIAAIGGLLVGFLIARTILKKSNDQAIHEAEEQAKLIIKEAEIKQESIKKEKILEAKERFMKMKQETEADLNQKKQGIVNSENRIKQKEQSLDSQVKKNERRNAELDSLKENVSAQLEIVKKKKTDLEALITEEASKLENISNLTAEEATEQIIELMKNEATTKASALIKSIEDEAKLTATKEAKKIV